MSWPVLTLLFLAVLAAVALATRGVLGFLRRRAVLDHPNPRSSHRVPTPRGGGLAVIGVLVPAWVFIGLGGPGPAAEVWVLALCAVGLAALSWFDDLGGLAPWWRLMGQAVAVAAALSAMPDRGPFFAGLLPGVLDTLAAALLWIWFVNLFNFMDGIDGIAGTETVCLGTGVVVAATVAGVDAGVPAYGLTAAAAALGFLWWNRPPARIFLGDVGSIPLGFLLGWLLLTLASRGQWAAALILPLYYLSDATITLARRGLRGERVWQAHHEHFYQKAVEGGLGHGAVVKAVLMTDLVLIVLAALAAAGWEWPALAAACLVVAGLLFRLGWGAPGRPPGQTPIGEP